MKALLLSLFVAPVLAGPYAIDDLPFPEGVPPELGALDFAPDGTLFAVLRRGDVFRATPTVDVAEWEWEHFASGLQNGHGIDALSRDKIRVSQMAEFTEITDSDQDGTADQYRVFASGWGLSGNYGESITFTKDGQDGYFIAATTASHDGPTAEHTVGEYSRVGRRGRNFSAVKWRGCILHCDPRGNLTPFCYGFRMPGGIYHDSGGEGWCSDPYGDWRATTGLYHLKKGAFFGHPSSLVWDGRWPKARDPIDAYRADLATYNEHRTWPAVQIPHEEMNSAGGEPCEIPSSFPHFPGQMLLPDGKGERITRIMLEQVNGVYQGACTHFMISEDLEGGSHGIRFSPDGQQIYLGRQRITPKKREVPFDITTFRILSNGFEITFNKDLAITLKKEDLSFQSFIYQPRWTYGSEQEDLMKNTVSGLTKTGERTYAVSLEDFRRGRVYQLNVGSRVKSKKDWLSPQNTLFYYTANEVPE
jgi:hypothetical protein